MQFTKATKKKSKVRAALFGPSGSGKTFTALRMATGLGGQVALIDTERGSASKYSDRFAFDVCELGDKSIDSYCLAIKEASGYDVLIIDSLSHGWQELLEQVEKLAQAKYRGNTWSAWSEGTPEQKRLINAILDFPGHVLATMRSKTEWTTEQKDGKNAPKRVGLAPEQGKGIEYEFDLLLELTVEHLCNVLKDRTGKYQDKLIEKPGEDFGRELAEWLEDGVEPPKPAPPKPELSDDEKKTRTLASFDKFIMENAAPLNVATPDYEKSFANIASEGTKGALPDFSLNELLAIWPKRKEIAAELVKINSKR